MDNKLWKQLSPDAKTLFRVIEGRSQVKLTDLHDYGSYRTVLFTLYELESRGFGKVKGRGLNSYFETRNEGT